MKASDLDRDTERLSVAPHKGLKGVHTHFSAQASWSFRAQLHSLDTVQLASKISSGNGRLEGHLLPQGEKG